MAHLLRQPAGLQFSPPDGYLDTVPPVENDIVVTKDKSRVVRQVYACEHCTRRGHPAGDHHLAQEEEEGSYRQASRGPQDRESIREDSQRRKMSACLSGSSMRSRAASTAGFCPRTSEYHNCRNGQPNLHPLTSSSDPGKL